MTAEETRPPNEPFDLKDLTPKQIKMRFRELAVGHNELCQLWINTNDLVMRLLDRVTELERRASDEKANP